MTKDEYKHLKIGDRVRLVLTGTDAVGVIIGSHVISGFMVQFDERAGMFHDCNGLCPPGRGFNLWPQDLHLWSLIPRPTLSERVNALWDGALSP